MATIFNNCLWASGRIDEFPCDANAVEAMSMSIAAGAIGLLSVGCLVRKLKTSPRGKAFLRTEYKYLTLFVVVFFALLLSLYTLEPPSGDEFDGVRYSCSFLAGAFLSALTGYLGMIVATDANVRTTQACRQARARSSVAGCIYWRCRNGNVCGRFRSTRLIAHVLPR